MRARGWLAAALGGALVLGGCGGEGRSRGQRAGSEPLPSSGPGVSVPASSSAPMFAGPASGPPRRGAGGGGPPTGIEAEALRLEAQRRAAERPNPLETLDAQGRRIATETMQAVQDAQAEAARDEDEVDGDQGPCDDAWDLRVARGLDRGRSVSRREQRSEFMRQCRALPEDQRNCMSPGYQGAHLEECAEIQERAGRQLARRAGVDVPR
ncbi:hypothetical protein [Sandaracinus amylolyticus]|uniref:Lipoprotein n=1 Tax=Sandaracinus amylolyticus TaxID=927083 RepID=A0A0F6YLH0_9BACT|nr:hypothetical protein [Sandaracinus amylolyticus]AKF09451.1 hypothetical protein DB32_006600 [Sandaracinus amylolyticus]